MPFGLAILGAAGISGASSLLSGILGSNASTQAAQAQEQAAQSAELLQANEYNANTARLQPFVNLGTNAAGTLSNLTGTGPGGNPLTAPLTKPFQPTNAQLASTPGYQFTLNQGMLATQNQLAGTQPGGAGLKAGINYAEGLAGTTFQQQFQNYLTQNQQIYGMLSGQVGTGENAAAQSGSLGIQSTNAISNLATGAGAASAAGTIGSANAITGALGSGSSGLTNAIGLSAITSAIGGNTPSYLGGTGANANAWTGTNDLSQPGYQGI